MPTVRFLGKVLPTATPISLSALPEVDFPAPEQGLTKMHFVITVVASNIEVTINLNRFLADDVCVIYNRAFDLARACVDTVSFATGQGFTINLEVFVDPVGPIGYLSPQNPDLGALCTFLTFPTVTPKDQKTFETALKVVLSEPPLFIALNDLIQANILPHHAPTNCGRVLDSLRKLVAPTVDSKKGWPILQNVVHADAAYMKRVSDLSTNPRHGDRSFISGKDTTESLQRTWAIMNRFLEYRKGGNQSLSLADFPFLLG